MSHQPSLIAQQLFSIVFLLISIFCVVIYFSRKYFPAKKTKHRTLEQTEQDYGIPCTTVRGEPVRSMAECFIANYLNARGFQYLYEEPFLISKERETIRLRPDFYLPGFDLVIEYWGLVDAKSEYEDEMRWKMALYHKQQIQFISIYPYNILFPFDPADFDQMFQRKFQKVTGIALRPLGYEKLTVMRHYDVKRRLDAKRLSRPVPS